MESGWGGDFEAMEADSHASTDFFEPRATAAPIQTAIPATVAATAEPPTAAPTISVAEAVELGLITGDYITAMLNCRTHTAGM